MFTLNSPGSTKSEYLYLIHEVQGVYSFVQHRSQESITELAAWKREIKSLSLLRQWYVLRDELEQWIWMCLGSWAIRLIKYRAACTFSSNSLLTKDFGQNFQSRVSTIMFPVNLKRALTALGCGLIPGSCLVGAEDRLFGGRKGF